MLARRDRADRAERHFIAEAEQRRDTRFEQRARLFEPRLCRIAAGPHLQTRRRPCARQPVAADRADRGAGDDTDVAMAERDQVIDQRRTRRGIVDMRRAGDIVAPHDIAMVMEPLNTPTDHPGVYMQSIAQGYAGARGANSPAVKILADLYHEQIQSGNLIPTLDLCWDEIGYIQFGDNPGRREPGTGEIHFAAGQAETVRAGLVFLCASAMASTQILMNSRMPGSERSHFDASGTLGRYVMDHNFRVGIQGEIPGMQDLIEYGRRPGGVYIPRFRNIGGDEGVGFRRGYGYQGSARRDPPPPVGFGATMKHGMRRYGPWTFSMGAFGECLPYADNRVSLHPTRVDRFGVPLMRFDVTFRENELRMMQDARTHGRTDARTQGEAMLRGAGLTNATGNEGEHVPGDAIHEMGGARMGRDPRRSVLNAWSQAHAASNLYVTDGAQMASVACVNPSLTFMALTARAVDHAVTQARKA